MSSYSNDYNTLYKIQDSVINLLHDVLDGFYLTGGTALDRFYLHHRYSNDLDFFINDADNFSDRVSEIFWKIKKHFKLEESLTLQTDTYTRFYLNEVPQLKIDIVNDVPVHWGTFNTAMNITIDNPANILSNKIGAVVSREEPKDVFDILMLSENYSFNWKEVFLQTIRKQVVNETDIAMKINSFPVELLKNKPWLKSQIKMQDVDEKLHIIADDFIFARDNSLGIDKEKIERAEVNISE